MALLANRVFGIVNMGEAVVRHTHNGHSVTLYYRKSGNFRYMKFSLENFRVVGSTSYENILTQKFYSIAFVIA